MYLLESTNFIQVYLGYGACKHQTASSSYVHFTRIYSVSWHVHINNNTVTATVQMQEIFLYTVMVNIKRILGKGILLDLIANKIPEI